MLNTKFLLAAILCAGTTATLGASPVCPSTATTTTDCDFMITVGSTGSVAVATVPGSMPFNSPMTLVDGSMEPGSDASLVGVVNNYSQALTSLSLQGSGATAGIFDFSFNGICLYTNAAYCATAATGYEGPTTTFGSLMIGGNFQTSMGNVLFQPGLGMGQSTYFALQDSAADINSHGGLTITGETFAGQASSTPEPANFALVGLGGSLLLLLRKRKQQA